MVSVARGICGNRCNYHESWTATADVLEALGAERRADGKIFPGAILRQSAWSDRHGVVVAAVWFLQGAWRGISISDAWDGIHGGKPVVANGRGRFVERVWVRTG